MSDISMLREAVVALHEQAHDRTPARTCQKEPCVDLNRADLLVGPDRRGIGYGGIISEVRA